MSNTPPVPESPLLRTPLFDAHVSLNAKMVPFAGWEMPVSYPTGTVTEVKACHTGIGLFDVSHMGEVAVAGPQAAEFLSYATTNDPTKLSNGQAQYSLLLNDSGGVIDDIIVYKLSNDGYMIVVNASRRTEDFHRFNELAERFDVLLKDYSDSTSLIAVQGPKALEIIPGILQAGSVPASRFEFIVGKIFDSNVTISRTGYTGEDGVELFCENDKAPAIWNALIELDCVPCGLGARDVLRVEAGYPLYGHELDESHSPFESGVGWAVKMDKASFAGKEALDACIAHKPSHKLIGLKCVSPAVSIPREGSAIMQDGSAVGEVTSGTLSPILGTGIALGRVISEFAKRGTQLDIEIRGRIVQAEVTRPPFVQTSLKS